MTRPSALAPIPDRIPAALRDKPQWIVWKHHFHRKRQRWIKLPLQVLTGGAAKVTDHSHLASFDAAWFAYEMGGYDGIGFVFTGNGLVGIDIDDCVRPEGLTPLATEILTAVPGYAELSPSGTGIHLITRATLDKARKSDAQGLELYNNARFFTITGHPIPN